MSIELSKPIKLWPNETIDTALNYLLAVELGFNVDHDLIGWYLDKRGYTLQIPNLLDDIQVAEKLCNQWNTFNITIEKAFNPETNTPIWVAYAYDLNDERNFEIEHAKMARAINLCVLAYRGKIKG